LRSFPLPAAAENMGTYRSTQHRDPVTMIIAHVA
jgi:hypothetical protein